MSNDREEEEEEEEDSRREGRVKLRYKRLEATLIERTRQAHSPRRVRSIEV